MPTNNKKRKYPPAVYRYRANHPTISATLTTELKKSIDVVKGDRSYTQVIRELIIGSFQPVIVYEKKIEEKNRTIQEMDEKIKKIENEIKRRTISYPCKNCGKDIIIFEGGKSHKFIKEYLISNGWAHSKCPQ